MTLKSEHGEQVSLGSNCRMSRVAILVLYENDENKKQTTIGFICEVDRRSFPLYMYQWGMTSDFQ